MATRETEGTIYTHAGPEIGVASTKAVYVAVGRAVPARLRLVRLAAPCRREAFKAAYRSGCCSFPFARATLKIAPEVAEIAGRSTTAQFFCTSAEASNYTDRLERRAEAEGDSYIHAEGYPAGEMKHGPIALIPTSGCRW